MKKLIASILMLFAFGPFLANAFGLSLNMTRHNYETGSEIPNEDSDPGKGNRTRPMPIMCQISESGIDFGFEFEFDIMTYEIYDLNGDCVAIFGDEISFVEYLFTLSGEYQLRFTTPNYELVGYVLIN